MQAVRPLRVNWHSEFEDLVRAARKELVLCAPYVSEHGVEAVCRARLQAKSSIDDVLLLTDLSPLAVCAGATDPNAILRLCRSLDGVRMVHLPRLHAKVYVADNARAIVTSGNLSHGGLVGNHEYGVVCTGTAFVLRIRTDITEMASLGGAIETTALERFCDLAHDAREAYQRQMRSASRAATRELNATLQAAGDSLIRAKIGTGPIHAVFSRTIAYLLRLHGPMSTVQMHPLIQQIHPDLCDDSVDRVIAGVRFGKKWKHAARTCQQQLKKQGVIERRGDLWMLAR